MTHITTDVDEDSIVKLCYSMGAVQDIALAESGTKMNKDHLVFVNGLIIGTISVPERLVKIPANAASNPKNL